MRVIRTNSGHICANKRWYVLKDLVDRAFEIAKKSGSINPAFDTPSWFYTGSPYADEIVALGCETTNEPENYQIECVPKLGKVWRSREPAWPEIFNCEVKDDFI